MATSAPTVANRFLELAKDRGKTLTPLQLMKLVYIAHGWMLGLHSRPLITDNIEAWKFGPVIPRLYSCVKEFGSAPVQGPLKERWFSHPNPLDDTEEDVIQQTFEVYGGLSGIRLSALTHQKGTPWAKTWSPNSWATQIPNDLISEHYTQLAHARSSVVD